MRRLLSVLIIFFVGILWGGASAKSVTFVQFSDVHIDSKGIDTDVRPLSESVDNFAAAIKQVNKMNDVDFIVFTGDNLNHVKKMDLALFAKMSAHLKKPYYVILGNHDCASSLGIDKKEYYRILNKFSKSKIKSPPPKAVKYDRNLALIFMDGVNQFIPGSKGYYREKELIWLDEQLRKFKNSKVVIFQHYPIVEPFVYKSHQTIDADKYLNVLKKHKNVIAVISGHYHAENEILRDGILHMSCGTLLHGDYKKITIEYSSKEGDYVIKSKVINIKEGEI